VGLAGSSAIVTATLQCLMAFFRVGDGDIARELQPQLALDVERLELRINAGLQDRVVQRYGGCVYMDFDKELIDTLGHGRYEPLDSRAVRRLLFIIIM
jgi:glucuronokinase